MVSLQPIAARPVVWLCPPWLYQPGPPRVQWDADGRGEQAVPQPTVQAPRIQVVIALLGSYSPTRYSNVSGLHTSNTVHSVCKTITSHYFVV